MTSQPRPFGAVALVAAALAAAACAEVLLTAQPLVGEDVLEPSVLNEVDHALARAPTNAPPALALPDLPAAHPFFTNGLSRAEQALRLVSAQRADGRWYAVWDGRTNDVTAVAVGRLEALRD